jgi:acetoacetyl-CoA reductase
MASFSPIANQRTAQSSAERAGSRAGGGIMQRVTGGTRGIGHAISITLKDAGHKVAANYVGNDAAARKFTTETGIPTFKFDIACEARVSRVVADLGPIEILVNNAGITRDVMLHKMTPGRWQQVIATDLGSCFNTCRLVIEGVRERGIRPDRQHIVDQRPERAAWPDQLCGRKGRHAWLHQGTGARERGQRHTVNAVAPGYTATDMLAPVPAKILAALVQQIPAGRLGHDNEIAHVVRFLVEDQAAFITGSTITVNGGQYMT